jgi:hypothetical protein
MTTPEAMAHLFHPSVPQVAKNKALEGKKKPVKKV